jgi:hypothetical protein
VLAALLQARDRFIADFANYSKFGIALKDLAFPCGKTKTQILDESLVVVNRGKLSKFEAFAIVICYKNQAKNRLKSIQKAESEFASAKQNPADVMFAPLWKKIVAVKAVGNAAGASSSSSAAAAAPRKK